MRFKHQDLMITELSTEVACGKQSLKPRTGTIIVAACTRTSVCGGAHSGLTFIIAFATLAVATCTFFFGRRPEDSAEQLALLKAQLKEALDEVEREEQSLGAEEQLRPKTREEAERLQDKLSQAATHLGQEKLNLPNE